MKTLLVLSILFFSQLAHTTELYKLDLFTESSIFVSSVFLSGYSLYKTQNIQTIETDLSLFDKNNINRFDRFATDLYCPKSARVSDVLLGICLISPFMLNFDSNATGNHLAMNTMILESYLITASLTQLAKVSFLRKRPYVYNENVDDRIRRQRDAQFSFFSGHTSMAFTGAILTAKMYDDINGKNSEYVYTGSILLASSVGYLRVRAGRHFPSDVIVGAIVGTSSAWLVTELHKTDTKSENNNLRMITFSFQF
jgi:membrane-associated phospholipid phosphatase